jgi:hypothetical protein
MRHLSPKERRATRRRARRVILTREELLERKFRSETALDEQAVQYRLR